MKYLVLVLVLVGVYWIFKAYKRKAGGKPSGPRAAEDMVRCAQCGVHLPRSESIAERGAFFCTPEHRRLHENID